MTTEIKEHRGQRKINVELCEEWQGEVRQGRKGVVVGRLGGVGWGGEGAGAIESFPRRRKKRKRNKRRKKETKNGRKSGDD